jgi:thiol-disulfide isomerase/thioredoxin
MKRRYFLFVAFLIAVLLSNICLGQTKILSWENISSVDLVDVEGKITHVRPAKLSVAIFLSPECPLSKNYISVLNKLAEEKRVDFYGIIPGASYSVTEVANFARDFKAAFPIYVDKKKKFTKILGGTTTPECMLISQSGLILYRGLIDNWAHSLGQQRKVITEKYLEHAINKTLMHKPITITSTKPVGCLINNL